MSVYAGDRPGWVRAAIESMLLQTVPREQIHIYICADGPLTGELDACLDLYKENVYRLLRNESNLGLAASLNRLIRALEDETYVFRMDADDLCLPERVARQVQFMDPHPEILLCGGAIQEFRDDPVDHGLLRTYPADLAAMRKYILKANPFAHSTVCFRREFFSRVGLYNEELPLRQDIELWFRAVALDVPMANLREPLLLFRISDDLVRRRNLRVGLLELRLFIRGIYRIRGVHPAMIWPVLRLVVRVLPPKITGWIYRRNVRKLLNAQ